MVAMVMVLVVQGEWKNKAICNLKNRGVVCFLEGVIEGANSSGVIVVKSALYGRDDRETCSEGRSSKQLSNTRCSQDGIVDIVKDRCDGLKSCEFNMTLVNENDPCQGISKYLKTIYQCLSATHLIVCQNSLAWLTCGKGQVISVYGADYGRRDRTTCSYQKPGSETMNVNCSNPAKEVAARCNGKQDCKIPASNSVFKDPCSDTYKYLEVSYTYHLQVHVLIDCPDLLDDELAGGLRAGGRLRMEALAQKLADLAALIRSQAERQTAALEMLAAQQPAGWGRPPTLLAEDHPFTFSYPDVRRGVLDCPGRSSEDDDSFSFTCPYVRRAARDLDRLSTEKAITCDGSGNVHRLQCSSGVIVVKSALYGRDDRETCSEGRSSKQLSNTRCSQDGIVDIVKDRCDGLKSCEFNMTLVNENDPCQGISKYLKTIYQCLSATHLIVCQNSLAWLTCGKGQVISVYGADYGRRDQTTCSYQKPGSETMNVNCSNPAKEVAARCNGKQDCKIPASNSVFKDPCSDTYKYLEVAYTCKLAYYNPYHGLLSKFHCLHLSMKMAELNKFTAEHQEETGSGGDGDGVPEPPASSEASSQLIVQQVRTVDQDGNLRVVYPSKTDLSNDISNLTVIWSSRSLLPQTCPQSHGVLCSGVIVVKSALYGRDDRETCSEGRSSKQLSNTRCSQDGIVDIVKDRCNGLKSCEFNMTLVNEDDPCKATSKYLKTIYQCLSARKGQVISVYGANYGRRDRSTCSYQKPGSETLKVNCSNPAKEVAARCNGKQDCKIPASNSVFKDPCSDTYKYLEVAYTCKSVSHNPCHGLLSELYW
ncbi:uncharacterized protein LOC133456406 [Cololabis saira]|uniref:uncharacterized protein LOC133456406 n=1 Tax=Cololabis saira TaxID=129043 RepID=UPI002AD274D0|nr:uncharacterized protein LOC133456406 [Cololabis saira]